MLVQSSPLCVIKGILSFYGALTSIYDSYFLIYPYRWTDVNLLYEHILYLLGNIFITFRILMYKCTYTDEKIGEITKFFVDGTFKVIFYPSIAHCFMYSVHPLKLLKYRKN